MQNEAFQVSGPRFWSFYGKAEFGFETPAVEDNWNVFTHCAGDGNVRFMQLIFKRPISSLNFDFYLVTGLAREPEGAELSAPGTAILSLLQDWRGSLKGRNCPPLARQFLPCYRTGEGA